MGVSKPHNPIYRNFTDHGSSCVRNGIKASVIKRKIASKSTMILIFISLQI